MDTYHFVLASQSPRRQQLLRLLGYPFEVYVTDVDEDVHLSASPADYVRLTAAQKAEAAAHALAAARRDTPTLLIAADTTVDLDGTILAKPADADDARRMLLALRGRTHAIHTGLCVVDLADGREVRTVDTAIATMRNYSPAEIDAYVATGDPFDKAGAYAVQHPQFNPVAALDGCYLAVLGLSLCELIATLGTFGVPCRAARAELLAAHRGYPCRLLDEVWEQCH